MQWLPFKNHTTSSKVRVTCLFVCSDLSKGPLSDVCCFAQRCFCYCTCFRAFFIFLTILYVKGCSKVSSPENGYHTSTGSTPGSTVSFYCNEGYERVGQATITCQSNHLWDNDTSECLKSRWHVCVNTFPRIPSDKRLKTNCKDLNVNNVFINEWIFSINILNRNNMFKNNTVNSLFFLTPLSYIWLQLSDFLLLSQLGLIMTYDTTLIQHWEQNHSQTVFSIIT